MSCFDKLPREFGAFLMTVDALHTFMTTDKSVLIIVPAYNEEDTIKSIVEELEQSPYDYVVINDGSSDKTPAILDEIRANHVDLSQNLGIGGAMQTGYKFAFERGYQVAVQFDGDGQHDIAYVERIVEPIIAGEAEMTIGSRFLCDENTFKSSRARRAGIAILSQLIKIMTGTRVFDVTSGFRAVNRGTMQQFVRYYPSDYPEPESLACMLASGRSVKEIGVVMHERQGGTSSIGAMSSMYYMLKVSLSILLARPYEGK